VVPYIENCGLFTFFTAFRRYFINHINKAPSLLDVTRLSHVNPSTDCDIVFMMLHLISPYNNNNNNNNTTGQSRLCASCGLANLTTSQPADSRETKRNDSGTSDQRVSHWLKVLSIHESDQPRRRPSPPRKQAITVQVTYYVTGITRICMARNLLQRCYRSLLHPYRCPRQ